MSFYLCSEKWTYYQTAGVASQTPFVVLSVHVQLCLILVAPAVLSPGMTSPHPSLPLHVSVPVVFKAQCIKELLPLSGAFSFQFSTVCAIHLAFYFKQIYDLLSQLAFHIVLQ